MGARSPKNPDSHEAARPAGNRRKAFFRLTEKQIQRFLSVHARSGCTKDTILQYRTAVFVFYDFLPEDKRVYQDTLSRWIDALIEQGYSSRTVCARLSVVNSLLDFLGRRDFQCMVKLERTEAKTADLTRAEYLQLLQEAKRQENVTLYLLVKTFAVAGLSVQYLDNLTREAVNSGVIQTERKRYSQTVELPTGLRSELLDYTMREGIRSGPVFHTRSGKSFNRSVVTNMIELKGQAYD